MKHDQAFRAGALALAKTEGVQEASKQLSVHPSMIYKWQRAANGGKPKKKAKAQKRRVKVMKERRAGPMPLMITGFACPHCGGPIELPSFVGGA